MKRAQRPIVVAVAMASAAALALLAPGAAATARPHPAALVSDRSAPGKFVMVGQTNVETGVPGVLETSSHHGFVAWPTNSGGAATIKLATVSPSGTISGAQTALSGWSGIGGQITLVPGGSEPQVIYAGIGPAPDNLNCVYAATGSSVPWSTEPGSLSHDCVNPEPAGAEGGLGELGAAWVGAGLKFHVDLDPSVPASSADGTIAVPATAFGSGMTFSPSDRAFWVAWGQTNGGSTDGYFVRNVNPSATQLKMPGTGSHSVDAVLNPGDLPFTSTFNGPFLAACSNQAVNCHLLLWHFGATKSMTVPHAVAPSNAAIAFGPAGRIWVVWGSRSDNTVKVTRTNKKDTKFGPVHTYRTSCVTAPIVAVSGPANGPAVVALECGAGKTVRPTVFATRVLAGLSEHLSAHKLANTSAHTLTVKVVDAGDAVSGAKVSFHGSTKTTNAKGLVSFTVPKHLAKGHYPVVAKHSGYLPAHATLKVT